MEEKAQEKSGDLVRPGVDDFCERCFASLNDEARMSNDEGMVNHECRNAPTSDFVIWICFVIRY